MPMYEYKCENCEAVEEELRNRAQQRDPGPPCTACGGPTSYVFSGSHPQFFRLKNLGGKPSDHNLKEI